DEPHDRAGRDAADPRSAAGPRPRPAARHSRAGRRRRGAAVDTPRVGAGVHRRRPAANPDATTVRRRRARVAHVHRRRGRDRLGRRRPWLVCRPAHPPPALPGPVPPRGAGRRVGRRPRRPHGGHADPRLADRGGPGRIPDLRSDQLPQRREPQHLDHGRGDAAQPGRPARLDLVHGPPGSLRGGRHLEHHGHARNRQQHRRLRRRLRARGPHRARRRHAGGKRARQRAARIPLPPGSVDHLRPPDLRRGDAGRGPRCAGGLPGVDRGTGEPVRVPSRRLHQHPDQDGARGRRPGRRRAADPPRGRRRRGPRAGEPRPASPELPGRLPRLRADRLGCGHRHGHLRLGRLRGRQQHPACLARRPLRVQPRDPQPRGELLGLGPAAVRARARPCSADVL
ncbi:MAG: Butyryl-CoA dehydrogenase, partial [uncultured Blastococcus sp.]